MKKLLIICAAALFASNLFATDQTVTERFSKYEPFAMKTDRTFLDGDIVEWAIRYARRKADDKLSTGEQATWLNAQYQNTETVKTDYGYLEMNENFEGGIKNITFNWGHGNENGYTVVLRMFVRGADSWEAAPVKTWSHSASTSDAWQEHVSYDVQLKKNSRIKFDNKSVTSTGEQPTAAKGRPLIGNITITPYLYYTKKQDTIALGNVTYVNTALINNIDAGSVTYSATGKASINATTGAVMPLDTGVAIITATWGEVSTSYKLYIEENAEVEMFNGTPTSGKYELNQQNYSGTLTTTWTSYWGGVKGTNSNFPSQTATLKARYNDKKYDNESMISSSSVAGGISELSFQWNLIGDEENTTWDIRVYVNDVEVGRLTDLGSGIKPQVQVFSVKNLDYSGNVVITIKNLSTVSTAYSSDNVGRIAIDNLQIKPFSGAGTCVLNETDNNPLKIALYTTPNTDIQLTRTLYADRYNTFCVPFAVEADDMEAYFGEGYKLYTLASSETSSTAITINFDESDGGIEAGVPYLIEVPADVVNPTFEDRTITVVTPSSASTDNVTFQGVYCQTLLDPANTPVEYFLGSNNVLYRPVAAEKMKGLRAYFKISNITPGAPIRMQVNKPSTPTELSQFTDSPTHRFTKIIQNGHLYILRGARVYDAQGTQMK